MSAASQTAIAWGLTQRVGPYPPADGHSSSRGLSNYVSADSEDDARPGFRECYNRPNHVAMEILDLRRVRSSQLKELLDEEERNWFEQLHWDYRPSALLVSKFIDSRSLSGFAAIEEGRGIGYSFFVPEEHKALIGDLYVSGGCAGQGVERQLANQVIETLRALPRLKRIEAQLIPFGPETLSDSFAAESFEVYPRLFMYLPLAEAKFETHGEPPFSIRRWDDRYFEATATLIVRCYAGHVDSRINDQYQSFNGALRFLKNIIVFPGCGLFQADVSYVALTKQEELAGVILGSMVATRIGHITQICVLPESQGQGVGAHLLGVSLEACRRKRYTGVSLTVTESNAGAVRLYDRFGFSTIKRFDAFLWDAEAGLFTSGRAREEVPSTHS